MMITKVSSAYEINSQELTTLNKLHCKIGSEWSTRDRIRPYPGTRINLANFKCISLILLCQYFLGHRGFTRFSRAGSQPHFAFRDNLQETMKRSDVDDKDKPIVPVIRFYEPRLGRVQKRSSN